MRILLLMQWFDPEPTFKGLLFARALREAGHEVQVITGFPNYPGGKLYSGYTIRPIRRELCDGVRIIRVPLYPSHDSSAIGRALNYLSFSISAAIVGVFAGPKPDVAYVYHPPLTVGIAAAVIGFVRRVPFVYDIQDLWPDTLAATGMISNRRLLRLIGKTAIWVYARAGLLIAQSPGFRQRLIERGVRAEKIRLIYNWCDEKALQMRARVPDAALLNLGGKFNLVFAGNMGKAQALTSVLDAAELLQTERPIVQFVLVGGGTEVEALKAYAQERKLKNVLFLPRMKMDEVGHVLDAADALLVHLRNSPLFSITLPSKTQAYLFTGKPIVMAVEGNAADLIIGASAGVCAKPEDAHSIAAAVIELVDLPSAERKAMGARGRKFYDEHLSLASGTLHMLDAFRQAIELRRGEFAK